MPKCVPLGVLYMFAVYYVYYTAEHSRIGLQADRMQKVQAIYGSERWDYIGFVKAIYGDATDY